ncbi:acyl-CoA synthetase (AMP-forming)/AMP-acid ligase II [Sphingomonas sp. BE138]|uniref:long-chain-fatty-acid--CoA ligase n=1 Tax=Sphingomonas sp. BE138 TaxID=2817845 RepID=UPI002860008A|nr:long-chain-fatty-acid--CoA ligase [Sphingomonas sp. BE138]MDR6788015.1 acyl-CoA synthetase (AMP-forming)/AMP-acid ligase II [Sphingomonas sp. BE138]
MNVAHFLVRSAIRHPARPLWILPDRAISYAEGRRRLDRVACSLLAVGVQFDRVAILSANRFEGFEAYLAAMHAGMAAMPMNPKLHAREYAHMLADSGAAILVYSSDFAQTVAAIHAEVALPPHVYCIGDWHAGMPGRPYDDLLAGEDRGAPAIDIDPDDVAWLFYTSGTTGRPKGAMETHRNLVAMVQHYLTDGLRDADETDVMLHLAPISHGTASIGLVFLARAGAQSFPLSKSFDPDKVCEAIERYDVTATMMAPTMVQMLVRSGALERHDVSSLRSIVYGGAAMHRAVLDEAMRLLGPIFVQGYGQGEAAACCTVLGKQDHVTGDDPVRIARLSSVGREATGVMIRIVDEEGRPLPTGVAGEITIRSDLVMRGYWNDEAAAAKAKFGRWLRTGDVGYLDDGGYLFLTDRVKDMIISGGSNIYPREIEEVLYRHPAVSEVAVIGVPDEKWGEAVVAMVVPREGAARDEAALINFTRDHIASFKKPKHVVFVESLPKSAYGKVLKRELRDQFHRTAGAA